MRSTEKKQTEGSDSENSLRTVQYRDGYRTMPRRFSRAATGPREAGWKRPWAD